MDNSWDAIRGTGSEISRILNTRVCAFLSRNAKPATATMEQRWYGGDKQLRELGYGAAMLLFELRFSLIYRASISHGR
jgi:hypothetical protein